MRRLGRKRLLACLLLSGCATTSPQPATPTDDIFPLAATPQTLPASATQTLLAAFGTHRLGLDCSMAADADDWRVACITAAGLRALTLTVSASGELTVESSPQVPKAFDPRRMVADIQLAFWPLAALVRAARGTAWRVEQREPATRRIFRRAGDSERMVAEVHYADPDPWNGRLWISNFELGYSLYLVTRAGTADREP